MTALATAMVGLPHEVPLLGPLPPAPPVPTLPPPPLVVAPLVVDPVDPAVVDPPPAPVVAPLVVAPLVVAPLVVALPLVVDPPVVVWPPVVVFELPPLPFGLVEDWSSEHAAKIIATRMLGPRAWIILRSVFMGLPVPFVDQVRVRRSGSQRAQ
jgi:hypothetical protein